jgi:UDP-glucuronate decarboxylase
LIDAGEEVICLDNFFTGSRDNIAHLLGCSRFELIRHDVVEPIRLEVDQIYNLACPASPVHYQFNPVKTVEANVAGTLNVLRLAQQIGARILQASTSEVYGDPMVHPQVETYRGNVNPLGPRACYDEGKRVAETLMMDYHRQDGVDIRIARIFNTYGSRMDVADGRVVSNFIVQALRGEPLTLYGTGDQSRSFCYVDDLVDGLMRLMNAEGIHDPINLGNPHEFTVQELALQIIELCGSTRSRVRYCPLPQDDPAHRRPDITRAQLLLNWTPKVELREGLERTIADFESRLTDPQASRVRATMRRALEHNGKQVGSGAALEHSNGKHVGSGTDLERSNGKQVGSGAALDHNNGKQGRPGAALEDRNGKVVRSDAYLSQPFFERAELAASSDDLAADFEGLWIR